jgi:hypothetical protein
MMLSQSSEDGVHSATAVVERTARQPELGTYLQRAKESAVRSTTDYWALVLSVHCARLYDCGTTPPQLRGEFRPAAEGSPVGPSDMNDPYARRMVQDTIQLAFLRQVDAALAPQMGHDERPLVVIGSNRSLASFYARTRYRTRVLATVPLQTVEVSSEELAAMVQYTLVSVTTHQHSATGSAHEVPSSPRTSLAISAKTHGWRYDHD